MDSYKNIHLLIICCVLELEQIIYDVVKARVCGFVSFEVTWFVITCYTWTIIIQIAIFVHDKCFIKHIASLWHKESCLNSCTTYTPGRGCLWSWGRPMGRSCWSPRGQSPAFFPGTPIIPVHLYVALHTVLSFYLARQVFLFLHQTKIMHRLPDLWCLFYITGGGGG